MSVKEYYLNIKKQYNIEKSRIENYISSTSESTISDSEYYDACNKLEQIEASERASEEASERAFEEEHKLQIQKYSAFIKEKRNQVDSEISRIKPKHLIKHLQRSITYYSSRYKKLYNQINNVIDKITKKEERLKELNRLRNTKEVRAEINNLTTKVKELKIILSETINSHHNIYVKYRNCIRWRDEIIKFDTILFDDITIKEVDKFLVYTMAIQ